jgi:hypothetical protein
VTVPDHNIRGANILLHVFLALLERCLGELRRNLGGRVIHKLPVLAKDVSTARCTAMLLLIGVAVALRLRL